MRSKPKRPKNKAANLGGGRWRSCKSPSEERIEDSDTIQGPLQASAPFSVAPNGSCVSSEDELVLIDKFGHLHARRILLAWPRRVLEAMGVRFIDEAEPMREAGHPQP
jgi:hypothetical protein